MTPELWQRLKPLFYAALKEDPQDRAAFIERSCGDDKDLKLHLKQLIEAEEQGTRTNDAPLVDPNDPVALAQDAPQTATSDQPALADAGPPVTVVGPGTQLGPYRIEGLIGSGGMGEVFRARDTRLNRTVAIKILPRDKVADTERKRRFLLEARAASALNHANIVTVHDISRHNDIDYLVMEYVRGKTLKELIPAQGLSFQNACMYGMQAASALASAHAARIIHRDIKPANIMVTAEGVIKVLDFGLAKLNEPSNDGGNDGNDHLTTIEKTMPGMIMGTAAYMSPEQVSGRPADARSDIFSLGLVLYEMLSGERAFRGETAISTMAAILHKEPRPLKETAPQTPPELERVVTRCLRKQPEQRYQSAVDLKFALEDLQGKSAVDTTPSIAVLPFANLSADKENEYFSDGLAEEIINAVSQVKGLRVGARSSAFSFRGKDIELAEIGRKLGVEHLLEGSVRKSGSRIRVTVQMVKAADGMQVWSERYDREMVDVFAVQDEIAQAIVEKLKGKLSGAPLPSSRARHSQNQEAYTAHLMGRHAFLRGDRASVTKAKEYFEKAIGLDPGYALAYCGLAMCLTSLPTVSLDSLVQPGVEAKRLYEKALELDGRLPEARAGLGSLRGLIDYDWQGAEREFQQALTAETVSPDCLASYGDVLWAQGRLEEALAVYDRASKLDPMIAVFVFAPANVFLSTGDYEKSLQQCRRALEIDNRYWLAHAAGAWSLIFSGQPDEALKALEAMKEQVSPSVGARIPGIAIAAHAAAGRTEQAREIDRQFPADGSIAEAIRAYWFGETDRMFERLHRLVDERSYYVFTFTNWAVYRHLYPDPRFQSLLRKLNLTPR